MLKIIYGKRGSGKTKNMIERANEDVAKKNGDLVFIDKDNHCMLDLHHDIRYMNACEYGNLTLEYFLGFVCGAIASNYDIEKIYIDGVPGIFESNELEMLVKGISKITDMHSVEIVMAISTNSEKPPEFITDYITKD